MSNKKHWRRWDLGHNHPTLPEGTEFAFEFDQIWRMQLENGWSRPELEGLTRSGIFLDPPPAFRTVTVAWMNRTNLQEPTPPWLKVRWLAEGLRRFEVDVDALRYKDIAASVGGCFHTFPGEIPGDLARNIGEFLRRNATRQLWEAAKSPESFRFTE